VKKEELEKEEKRKQGIEGKRGEGLQSKPAIIRQKKKNSSGWGGGGIFGVGSRELLEKNWTSRGKKTSHIKEVIESQAKPQNHHRRKR